MRSAWIAAVALLPAVPLAAQDDGDVAARLAAQAQAEYQRLIDDFTLAVKERSARIAALSATDEYKALRTAGDREAMAKLMATVPDVPLADFMAKASDAAERWAGKDGAVPFLTWIALNARDAEATAAHAVDTLVTHHLGSDKLVDFAQGVARLQRSFGEERVAELITRLVDGDTQPLVKAHALFARATAVQRDRAASAERHAAAEADLRRVVELAAGTTLALRANAPAFEKERLQIGMEVPDIVGEDLDGVPFKLSDYRGKVVVLDFWGDW